MNEREETGPRLEAPIRPGTRRVSSLVLVNTGHGKGKSTAAFGMIMRAVARDWPVCVIQFIKSGRWHTGEEKVARQLGVAWNPMGDGFSWESEDLDESKVRAQEAWAAAKQAIASDTYRLVVLDEITYPMNWGWITNEEVTEAILARPKEVNVVATGRDAPKSLIEIADTVTEMRNVRHAFDSGVPARKGIDY